MSLLGSVATLMVFLVVIAKAECNTASNQLLSDGNKPKCPIEVLTTFNGAPVEISDTTTLNTPDLIQNDFFIETLTYQVQEKIPERIAHMKGTGAFGYFEVTHNISDICRASLFESDGKRTPIIVRFSPGNVNKGGPDTLIDARGFVVKFYTDEGNFDIVGFNTPLFSNKDPQTFLLFHKMFKINPLDSLNAPNVLWNFISRTPEVLPVFLYLHGDDGIPDGYRHMPGYSIHTYQVYNKYGESHFVRFHFDPDNGIKNVFLKDALKLSCSDLNYAVRDLYDAIKKGNYPSWTVKVQVLTYEDVKKCKFNPFDVTKTLPEDKYPFRTVGKLVLNRNPTNYFTEVEQTAFCPGNLVRGILGAPDNVFKARRFAYKVAQQHRLGPNFQKIEVNKPYNEVFPFESNENPPACNKDEEDANYYQDDFNSPFPYVDKTRPKLIRIKQIYDSNNFEQTTERYMKMTKEQRQRMSENIAASLRLASKTVQHRTINLLKSVHPVLAFETLTALT